MGRVDIITGTLGKAWVALLAATRRRAKKWLSGCAAFSSVPVLQLAGTGHCCRILKVLEMVEAGSELRDRLWANRVSSVSKCRRRALPWREPITHYSGHAWRCGSSAEICS